MLYHLSLVCVLSIHSELESLTGLFPGWHILICLVTWLHILATQGIVEHYLLKNILYIYIWNLLFPAYIIFFKCFCCCLFCSLNSILGDFLTCLLIIGFLLICKSRGSRCCSETLSTWLWVVNCDFHWRVERFHWKTNCNKTFMFCLLIWSNSAKTSLSSAWSQDSESQGRNEAGGCEHVSILNKYTYMCLIS